MRLLLFFFLLGFSSFGFGQNKAVEHLNAWLNNCTGNLPFEGHYIYVVNGEVLVDSVEVLNALKDLPLNYILSVEHHYWSQCCCCKSRDVMLIRTIEKQSNKQKKEDFAEILQLYAESNNASAPLLYIDNTVILPKAAYMVLQDIKPSKLEEIKRYACRPNVQSPWGNEDNGVIEIITKDLRDN